MQEGLSGDSGHLSFVLVDPAPQEKVLHILNSLRTLALGGVVVWKAWSGRRIRDGLKWPCPSRSWWIINTAL